MSDTDPNYSNREIDSRFVAVLDKIGAFETSINSRMGVFEVTTRDSLNTIINQTTKTNGHVAEAQREIAENKAIAEKKISDVNTNLRVKMAYAYGFCAAIGMILVSIAIPIITAYIHQ